MENPIETLTKSLPSWGAKIAFGESITVGGRDVLPAALVVFGFGGGGGAGKWIQRESTSGNESEGSGGGGGGYALPIGAYVDGPNGPKFQANPVALMIVSVPLVTAAGWALARIIAAASRSFTAITDSRSRWR